MEVYSIHFDSKFHFDCHNSSISNSNRYSKSLLGTLLLHFSTAHKATSSKSWRLLQKSLLSRLPRGNIVHFHLHTYRFAYHWKFAVFLSIHHHYNSLNSSTNTLHFVKYCYYIHNLQMRSFPVTLICNNWLHCRFLSTFPLVFENL